MDSYYSHYDPPLFKDRNAGKAAMHKWLVRKRDGKWWVWRPQEAIPVQEFDSFESLMAWKPDCQRFLRGYCHCRNECAY